MKQIKILFLLLMHVGTFFSSQKGVFECLPDELILRICIMLTNKSYNNLSVTSKFFNNLVKDKEFSWKFYYKDKIKNFAHVANITEAEAELFFEIILFPNILTIEEKLNSIAYDDPVMRLACRGYIYDLMNNYRYFGIILKVVIERFKDLEGNADFDFYYYMTEFFIVLKSLNNTEGIIISSNFYRRRINIPEILHDFIITILFFNNDSLQNTFFKDFVFFPESRGVGESYEYLESYMILFRKILESIVKIKDLYTISQNQELILQKFLNMCAFRGYTECYRSSGENLFFQEFKKTMIAQNILQLLLLFYKKIIDEEIICQDRAKLLTKIDQLIFLSSRCFPVDFLHTHAYIDYLETKKNTYQKKIYKNIILGLFENYLKYQIYTFDEMYNFFSRDGFGGHSGWGFDSVISDFDSTEYSYNVLFQDIPLLHCFAKYLLFNNGSIVEIAKILHPSFMVDNFESFLWGNSGLEKYKYYWDGSQRVEVSNKDELLNIYNSKYNDQYFPLILKYEQEFIKTLENLSLLHNFSKEDMNQVITYPSKSDFFVPDVLQSDYERLYMAFDFQKTIRFKDIFKYIQYRKSIIRVHDNQKCNNLFSNIFRDFDVAVYNFYKKNKYCFDVPLCYKKVAVCDRFFSQPDKSTVKLKKIKTIKNYMPNLNQPLENQIDIKKYSSILALLKQ